jgi:tetratricopeptide (TPR) repeat protein
VDEADPTTDPSDDRESAYELLQRGQALLKERHFAQAATVLERADRAEPGRGSILAALGREYFNSGQAERARATFEALLEVEPSSHYAHYAIGQSLKRLGRTERARTHLRLAVALSPGNALYEGALARLRPGEETEGTPRKAASDDTSGDDEADAARG